MAKDIVVIISRPIDPHADVMVECLERRNVRLERLHPGELPALAKLSVEYGNGVATRSSFTGQGVDVAFEEIKSVWLRRIDPPTLPEGLSEKEREFAAAETSELLYGLYRISDAFWVNPPDKSRIGSCKPYQLEVARNIGFKIPRTLITNDAGELRSFFEACNGGIIYKTMTQGFLGLADYKMIYTNRVTADDLEQAALLRSAPGQFQELIPKSCDLRITIIGRRVFAVEIQSQEDPLAVQDWRRAEPQHLKHSLHTLPAEVEKKCCTLLDRLELNYGAIDMVLTPDGEYIFLEINPAGQFGWIDELADLPLTETLADMLAAGARLT